MTARRPRRNSLHNLNAQSAPSNPDRNWRTAHRGGTCECLFAALFRDHYYNVTDEFAARVRMTKLKSFFKLITEPGPLVVLAVAIAMLVGIAGPASAQFFNFNPFASQPAPRQGGGR